MFSEKACHTIVHWNIVYSKKKLDRENECTKRKQIREGNVETDSA